jgi:hypothetical protein
MVFQVFDGLGRSCGFVFLLKQFPGIKTMPVTESVTLIPLWDSCGFTSVPCVQGFMFCCATDGLKLALEPTFSSGQSYVLVLLFPSVRFNFHSLCRQDPYLNLDLEPKLRYSGSDGLGFF